MGILFKKNTKRKIGKRVLCLTFAFLFSINSFAAVVSDNDGSAFITKAEFDSLKNNFQSQLDNYNSNIDSKIDSAIASYLAGIKVQKKTTNKIIHSTWDEITCLGYPMGNSYELSNYNLSYNAQFNGQPGNPSTTWNFYECWNTWYKFVYTRNTGTYKQRRLLCDAGAESNTNPNYITWLGYSANLLEIQSYNIFDLSSSWFNENTRINWYLGGTDQSAGKFIPTYLTWINAGYYPNLQTSVKNIWQPGLKWNSGTGHTTTMDKHGTGEEPTAGVQLQTASTEIQLLPDSNNVKIYYNHIIYFKNESTGYYTDVDWLHTLRIDPNATWVRQNPLQATSVSHGTCNLQGARYSLEANKKNPIDNDVRPQTSSYGSEAWTGSYGNADNTNKLPYLGLVSKYYDAKHIYQNKEKISVKVGNKEIKKDTYDTLLEGSAIMAGLDGDTIEWQPKFLTYNSGASANYNVRVKLVIGTFDASDTITSGSVVCKNENQTEDYLVTQNGTCSFKFKMPKDGIVFAKWWPDDNTIYTGNAWEIALDIPNCNQYTRTEKES